MIVQRYAPFDQSQIFETINFQVFNNETFLRRWPISHRRPRVLKRNVARKERKKPRCPAGEAQQGSAENVGEPW